MRLIDPNIVTFKGKVSDAELTKRLVHEAYEQAGFLDDTGKPMKGTSASILRFGGKAGHGGYSIEVSRDLRQSDQPRLAGPGGA